MTQPVHVITHESVWMSQSALLPQLLTSGEQLREVSLQVEIPLHATPSSQVRGLPPQPSAPQTSSIVQNSPSSQVAPSFGDQPRGLRLGSQIRQIVSGSSLPTATHSPSTRQPGQVASHTDPASGLHKELGGQEPASPLLEQAPSSS